MPVAKFPFRHLRLTGFVTREFYAFSHSHLPWGDAGALLARHPCKDSRDASGLDSVACSSLSAGLGWAGLGCGWLALGALIYTYFPLKSTPSFFFFFFKAGMMMSNVMLMLQLQTRPLLAQPL